jgi:hypothetical protein
VGIDRSLAACSASTASRTTLSQPVNGNAGVLAFHDRQLVGILQLKARDGLVYDIHAVADPVKLAFVQQQLVL